MFGYVRPSDQRLTEEERQWLDAYHAMVWETLADDLAPAEQAWLRAQTAPLED